MKTLIHETLQQRNKVIYFELILLKQSDTYKCPLMLVACALNSVICNSSLCNIAFNSTQRLKPSI